MPNYIVQGSDLSSVATAIRTKGSTSAQLAFPTGFVSAIEALPSGGGGLSLLASGHFTLAEQGSTVSIPVSFTGTPINVFVVFEGEYTGLQHTHAWSFIASYPTAEFAELFDPSLDHNAKCAINITSAGSVNVGVPIRARIENSNLIDVRQTGNNYPCLAGQYDWYIYGEAAS